MFYLLLGILSNTTVFFVMKYSESHEGNRYAATLFNYIVGMIISFLLMKEKVLFYNTPEGWFALGLALFNAVCMTGGIFINQMNVGKNGAPLTATFGKMGVLIPIVLSAFLFREIPTVIQFIGLAAAVFAIVYINEEANGKTNIQSLPLLFVLFIVAGLIDFNSKLYAEFGQVEIKDYYIFYSFVFNTVLSLILLLMRNRRIRKQDVVNGVMMGIPNQLITYCMVNAVLYRPAYLAFPLASAGVIVAVNIVNFSVFHEKLSPRELRATLMIGVALILLNM